MFQRTLIWSRIHRGWLVVLSHSLSALLVPEVGGDQVGKMGNGGPRRDGELVPGPSWWLITDLGFSTQRPRETKSTAALLDGWEAPSSCPHGFLPSSILGYWPPMP